MTGWGLTGEDPFINIIKIVVLFNKGGGFFGEKGLAIFSAFAVPDVNYFAGQIDVILLESDYFADT